MDPVRRSHFNFIWGYMNYNFVSEVATICLATGYNCCVVKQKRHNRHSIGDKANNWYVTKMKKAKF